jgi:5-methyltetrahydrofolate--homocysteine methyltransferase
MQEEKIEMLIVGERINSTRKTIREAIKARDAGFILNEAKTQLAAGAEFIDVNCAVTSGSELADIDWVINVIQGEVKDFSICIDSPDHLAIEAALKVYRGGGSIIINSITGDEARINNVLPLAMKHNAKVVALTMSEKGMPDTAGDRAAIAEDIIAKTKKLGFDPSDLYFDPLIRPISTEPMQGREFLNSIPLIKGLDGAKTICGLSNISYGLPKRSIINSAFLSMALYAGLDAAILDPTDKNISSALAASSALVGQDEYCAGYIGAFREGKLA